MSCENVLTTSRLYSLNCEEISASQNTIVNGDKIDVIEVKKTESDTLPFFMCVSKPETCPPGTIRTIADAIAKRESLKIIDISNPITGRRMF